MPNRFSAAASTSLTEKAATAATKPAISASHNVLFDTALPLCGPKAESSARSVRRPRQALRIKPQADGFASIPAVVSRQSLSRQSLSRQSPTHLALPAHVAGAPRPLVAYGLIGLVCLVW